jgi:cell filamentation protein, protein adenylyltransferase
LRRGTTKLAFSLYPLAMDPKSFADHKMGRPIKGPGRHGFYSYHPKPLPRSLQLDEYTVKLLSEADNALGRLAGAGRLLRNPHLLVTPYILKEAVASSRIEGTQASISDVFDASAIGGQASEPIREVQNYVAALNEGLELLESLPPSLRLVRTIHKTLLTDVRGSERMPGEFRKTPNWIGSPDDRPDTAVFVPPPVDEMTKALSDWEKFIHDDTDMPELVRCALLHYQFETIHPFLDGNGRVGRLLIVFYLVWRGRLPHPLLYVSSFFETHRSDYYDYLQAVRERGAVDDWLRFFLSAVAEQATDAVDRAERLADVREHYRDRLAGSRSRAHEIVDLLFENPYLTIRGVVTRLGVTHPGAANLIRQLEDANVLTEVDPAKFGRKRWVALEIRDIIG